MTPVQFLTQAQALRPTMVRTAVSITHNWHDAEEVVQAATYCSARHIHEYDEKKASLQTWLTRIVRYIALRCKRDSTRWHLHHTPVEGRADFDDLAPYDPTDTSMRHVHDKGLPQVRLLEPGNTKRALRTEKPGPRPEPCQLPKIEDALDVHSALMALPVEQREAVRAVFMSDGCTEKEYAREIGVCHSTVTKRLTAARKTLRKLLSCLLLFFVCGL